MFRQTALTVARRRVAQRAALIARHHGHARRSLMSVSASRPSLKTPAASQKIGDARRNYTGIPGGCYENYMRMKGAGEIKPDPRQEVCIQMLDELAGKIANYQPSMTRSAKPAAAPAAAASGGGGGGGFFGGLFGGGSKPAPAPKPAAAPSVQLKPAMNQRGLYLWGGTGTGKTFMMDMFHDKLQIKEKKRIHFHEWMIDVHNRLHQKTKGSSGSKNSADDYIEQVADDMIREAWCLCFDEFQVTHISDAIIMKRIFSVLFERGAVVVATSNRPPEDLYLNGLNRPLFLPFIPMLNDFCHVHAIGAEVDYRMISTQDGEDDRTYITPNGDDEKKILEYKFAKICQGNVLTGAQIETQGRKIVVPRCAESSSVAWFDFKDLCDKALGAADYLAIGTAFHTVFIANIPALTMQEKDQVRRLITCIDSFYERHTKVLCTADLDPIKLFFVSEEERKTSIADEIFAWDRTVSRLMEMQSAKYLADQAQALDADQFLGQFKLTALTDDDMKDMWRRYDKDDSGEMEMTELRTFLEDLLEKQKGHRNVSDETFETCKDTIDLNKDGVISFDEFQTYLSDYSTVRKTANL